MKIQLCIISLFSKTPWHFIDMEKFTRQQGLLVANESRKCSKEYFLSMKRKDGREEFIHSDRVSQIITYHIIKNFPFWHRIFRSMWLDKLLSAVYFHDVPENISLKAIYDIKRSFKNVVSMWVWALTIKTELGEGSPESFSEISKWIATILIKLGDRLHNLRNMSNHLGEDEFFTEKRLQDQIDGTWEDVPRLVAKALKSKSLFTSVIISMFNELLEALVTAQCKLHE